MTAGILPLAEGSGGWLMRLQKPAAGKPAAGFLFVPENLFRSAKMSFRSGIGCHAHERKSRRQSEEGNVSCKLVGLSCASLVGAKSIVRPALEFPASGPVLAVKADMIADTYDPFTQASVQHLVTAAVIGIFGAWAVRNARRDASRNRNGDYVLEHGLPGKAMVIFCWLIGTAVTAAFYLKRPESPVWLGFAAGTVALGYFMSIAIFGTRIEFDALDIRPRTPWNRSRVIPWAKVEAVEGTKAGGYRVRTATDGRLYIHPHFSGVNTFLTEAGRHHIPVIPFRA